MMTDIALAKMTRIAKLIALRDAVKEGRVIQACDAVEAFPMRAVKACKASQCDMNAALAFHEAVLPGALVSSMDQDSRRRWYVTLTDIRGQFLAHNGASHPAIALLLADITALIAIEEEK